MNDEKISKERLKTIQRHLFNYQINKNKSFENKLVDVLVENTIKGQTNLFGRNQYMNSVIFEGEENSVGKIVKVKILNSNQNTLFGKISKTKDMRAA